MSCTVCLCEPCQTPGFCGYCLIRDAGKAVAKPLARRSIMRRKMVLDSTVSLESLWGFLNSPKESAPATTVEALMIVLRRDGLKGLELSVNRGRLARLDEKQIAGIGDRLLQPKLSCHRSWSDEEVAALMDKYLEVVR